MTIHKIIGEHGALSQLCRGGACPAAVLTAEGDVLVQGELLQGEESGQLAAPTGEGFVKMPRATFEKIARHVLAS